MGDAVIEAGSSPSNFTSAAHTGAHGANRAMTDATLRQNPMDASTQKEVLTMTNKNTGNITTESDKIPRATQGDRRDPIERAATPGTMRSLPPTGRSTDSIIKENAGRIGVRTAPSAAILTVRDTATDVVGVSSDCPSGNAVLGSSNTRVGVRGTSNTGVGVPWLEQHQRGRSWRKPQQHRCVCNNATFPGVIGISVSHVGVFGSSSNDVGVRGIGSLHTTACRACPRVTIRRAPASPAATLAPAMASMAKT